MNSITDPNRAVAHMEDALATTASHTFDVQVIEGTDIVQVKMRASDAYVAGDMISRKVKR